LFLGPTGRQGCVHHYPIHTFVGYSRALWFYMLGQKEHSMKEDVWSHYGQWEAAAVWILLFGVFVLFVPFYRKADRKPAGAFLAFVTAFALEMFGAPLSLYFVMWAFGKSLPEGFLWGHTLSGSIGMAGHYIYLLSILAGGILIIAGWARIHNDYWSREEGEGRLVQNGLYRYIRHPQYAGFLLIALGVLFEWATIPLIILWPVLVILYYRLARCEEYEMEEQFGAQWRDYRAKTGMFIPWI
jgi:methanethiol S-methyltransferase